MNGAPEQDSLAKYLGSAAAGAAQAEEFERIRHRTCARIDTCRARWDRNRLSRSEGLPSGGPASGPRTIRVAIVAEVRAYGDALAEVVGREPGISVVSIVASAELGSREALRSLPHVLLLDTDTRGALDAVRLLAREAPGVRVLALAVPEFESESAIISCAEAGVAGYVPRGASTKEVVAGVRSVASGGAFCSSRIAAALLRQVHTLAQAERGPLSLAGLTPREQQVVQLIEEGLSNKEIASRLCIELPTAKHHVHNILEKLHLARRGQVTARIHRR